MTKTSEAMEYLARYMTRNPGSRVLYVAATKEEAEKFLAKFRETYPELTGWFENIEAWNMREMPMVEEEEPILHVWDD